MPDYFDIHNVPEGTSAEDIAKAHAKDLQAQGKYGVEYHKYWFNESAGKVFCLCHAPSPEAAMKVHEEAHGLIADQIIEVQPGMAELFMGGAEVSPVGAVVLPGATNERDSGIRTILFTDIVGSTALTQRLGDDGAMTLLHAHDRIVRDGLTALGGREVKHTGDGIMASFVSAASATRCATRIQKELADGKEDLQQLKVRIGLAAGEPVEHHDDLFGSTVQMAARLCSYAQAEQIIVSNVVAELCMGKGLAFEDLGEISLKGFEQPIRAHAVPWN